MVFQCRFVFVYFLCTNELLKLLLKTYFVLSAVFFIFVLDVAAYTEHAYIINGLAIDAYINNVYTLIIQK